MLDRRRQVLERRLHLPAEEVGEHRAGAAIRDVEQVGLGHHLEQLTCNMR
jgi:hypothetical protein